MMRIRSVLSVVGLSGTLALVTGTAAASAAKPPGKWTSPATITSGVPFTVSSITRCPALPTRGDTLEIQINVTFSGGGGSGLLLGPSSVDNHRNWSGMVTYSGISGSATLTAECLDVSSVTGTPYAMYESHPVTIG